MILCRGGDAVRARTTGKTRRKSGDVLNSAYGIAVANRLLCLSQRSRKAPIDDRSDPMCSEPRCVVGGFRSAWRRDPPGRPSSSRMRRLTRARGERGHRATPTVSTARRRPARSKPSLTALEEGAWTSLAPSGQAANILAILPFIAGRDHLLMFDSVYPPMRDFAETDLRRLVSRWIISILSMRKTSAARIRPTTRMVWCESPGSTTMEVIDLPGSQRSPMPRGLGRPRQHLGDAPQLQAARPRRRYRHGRP